MTIEEAVTYMCRMTGKQRKQARRDFWFAAHLGDLSVIGICLHCHRDIWTWPT